MKNYLSNLFDYEDKDDSRSHEMWYKRLNIETWRNENDMILSLSVYFISNIISNKFKHQGKCKYYLKFQRSRIQNCFFRVEELRRQKFTTLNKMDRTDMAFLHQTISSGNFENQQNMERRACKSIMKCYVVSENCQLLS